MAYHISRTSRKPVFGCEMCDLTRPTLRMALQGRFVHTMEHSSVEIVSQKNVSRVAVAGKSSKKVEQKPRLCIGDRIGEPGCNRLASLLSLRINTECFDRRKCSCSIMSDSSFATKKLNASTFLVTEDDTYGEHPLIYVKVHPTVPVIVIGDTGCDRASKPKKRGKRFLRSVSFCRTLY
jgi:glutaredoxin